MDNEDKKYGVPEQKKFPMPDADHVRSAIRFFNYVEPRYEKELARAILKRMREYGLTFDDFTVGEENRFSKYIPKDELKHYGILGMHWGVRRYQNKDGSWTSAGLKRRRDQEGSDSDREARKRNLKKAAVVAGVALAAGVATYAGYKHLSASRLTSSKAAVSAGKQFVDQMSDMIAPSTIEKITKPQSSVQNAPKSEAKSKTQKPQIMVEYEKTLSGMSGEELANEIKRNREEITKTRKVHKERQKQREAEYEELKKKIGIPYNNDVLEAYTRSLFIQNEDALNKAKKKFGY